MSCISLMSAGGSSHPCAHSLASQVHGFVGVVSSCIDTDSLVDTCAWFKLAGLPAGQLHVSDDIEKKLSVSTDRAHTQVCYYKGHSE